MVLDKAVSVVFAVLVALEFGSTGTRGSGGIVRASMVHLWVGNVLGEEEVQGYSPTAYLERTVFSDLLDSIRDLRSEERRVGKECQ